MKKINYLVFIFFCTSIFSYAQEESSFDSIYYYMENKEYDEALVQINYNLNNSNEISIHDINTLLFNKGFIFEMQDKLDSAIWCYEEVIASDSMHIPSLNSLGMLYGDFELYNEAYSIFYNLIEIDSNLIVPYSNIVYYKGLEGNYEDAIQIANEALLLDTDTITTALLLNNLSFAQYNLGLLKQAFKSATKSLKLLDKNAYAYRNLGLILLAQKKNEKACEKFNISFELGGTEDINFLIDENCNN
ncbi:hypothetical protein ABWH96_08290 [Marivirga tractuosa]|uniref:tetratricopeptide repeat protein n=1 Tax=Marivirga tractuosa TaxID=1006 RepID=UPI0035CECDDD